MRIGALSIASNTVHNAIGPCILSTAVFGPMEASRIADNTLVDCARSINLVGAGDVLRSAIIVAVKTSHLSIAGNMIEASGAVPVALPKS